MTRLIELPILSPTVTYNRRLVRHFGPDEWLHGMENSVQNGVSAEIPDWSREDPRGFWDPSRKLLRAVRRYQYWQNRGGISSNLFCKWFVLTHRFWTVITGADIPLNCKIGGGLLIPHPNGIV